jgi:hypothetical protein
MTFYSTDYDGSNWAIDFVDDVRQRAEAAASALDPIPYSPDFFNYDAFKVLVESTLRQVGGNPLQCLAKVRGMKQDIHIEVVKFGS